MPKPKTLLKLEAQRQKQQQQQKQQALEPETADEFLAAGVELEEGGEKWRAGDPAKGMRFYTRAISMYEDGLQKWPASFDLAYNKARTQYEVTQHPKLSKQLSASLPEMLQVTLESHRHALTLNQDNADALFNTAQVLTSLAEAILNTTSSSEETALNNERTAQAKKYVLEALDFFQRVLSLQELQYTKNQEEGPRQNEDDMMVDETDASKHDDINSPSTGHQPHTAPAPASSDESEQWAAIVEPVTKETLLDTATAQLQTLSLVCTFITPADPNDLLWIKDYSHQLLTDRITNYLQGCSATQEREVALARAVLISSLAEAVYRCNETSVDAYKHEISGAFAAVPNLREDAEALVANADALSTFSSVVGEREEQSVSPAPLGDAETFQYTIQRTQSHRWQALSTALDALTTATKLPSVRNPEKIHLARGDMEMHRRRLGQPPWPYKLPADYANVLLRNARTYYRGAAAIARRDGVVDVEREASAKEAFVMALGGETATMSNLLASNRQGVMQRAEDAVEEGTIAAEEMKHLFNVVEPDVIVI